MGDAWIRIESPNDDPNLKLAVEDWKYFSKTKIELDDLPGDSRVAFDLGYRLRSLVLEGVIFDDVEDYEECIKYLDSWNDIDSFVIKIQRHSGGSYLKIDGVNEELNFLYVDISEGVKLTRGDEQRYRIGRILFKQA